MALHPDLLDKHLLLLSRPAILNPLLAFPTCVRYTYLRDSLGDVEIDSRRERARARWHKQWPENWDGRSSRASPGIMKINYE